MQLAFCVDKQNISRLDNNKIVSGSKNHVRAKFCFITEEWNDIAKTAFFHDPDTDRVWPQVLVDDVCDVPWEWLDTEGIKHVSVCGGELITTTTIAVPILSGGCCSTGLEHPKEPSLSFIEQVHKLIEHMQKLINEGQLGGIVQADHAQNDPTQPDHIKNRIAYHCRKFDDIEAVDYENQVVAYAVSDHEYGGPLLIKIADLPENALPSDVINELCGAVQQGIEVRFDDPQMFPPEYLQYLIRENFAFDESGNCTGSIFTQEGHPVAAAISSSNIAYEYTLQGVEADEYGEIDVVVLFPEPGLYVTIIDSTEENGVRKYVSVEKALFRDVVRLDKSLLPADVLHPSIEVDNYPEQYSYNPITSDAVYTVANNLQNSKMDKVTIASWQEGYVLKVVDGKLQLAQPT